MAQALRLGVRFPPFETGLLFSLLLHVALWQVFAWRNREQLRESNSIEIDLTRPFRLTSDPRLARRAEVSGTGAPVVTTPKPLPPTPLPDTPKTVPQEWVLPGPNTKILEQPTTAEPALPGGLGGLGEGPGGGEVDWIYLTDLPRMLNRDDLAKNLQRFYPEIERRAGREGDVLLDIHIDRAGRVGVVDIVESAGKAFDAAAQKVIQAARFSPAKVGSRAVAVKIRQSIAFRLQE